MSKAPTLVFACPDAKAPSFYVSHPHVYTYPEQDLKYWVNGEFWYDYPDGKTPVFYQHEGFLYDYPTPGERLYELKAGVVR